LNSKQILLALIVPITWGLGFTLAKIGMEQFSALLIMSIRFGIAGLVLVWFTKPPWGHMREIFVVALIGSTIQYGLTYNGLKGIDASTAAILVQLEGPILSGITILAWVAIMATPQMLIASLIIEDGQWQAITSASLVDWSIIFYLAFIMTVVGYSVWYHLLSSVDVSKVSPFLMLLPITSIIAGMVLLDEKLTLSMIIGGLMIMTGVASTLINWRWPKKQINLP